VSRPAVSILRRCTRIDPRGGFVWTAAMQLLREATSVVPAVRYALGVAGVMAALALGSMLFKNAEAATFGVLAMFISMVLLLVFAAASALGGDTFRLPALVMTWAILILFIASAAMSLSAIFFDTPKPLTTLMKELFGGG
jgi:hypothetical protein